MEESVKLIVMTNILGCLLTVSAQCPVHIYSAQPSYKRTKSGIMSAKLSTKLSLMYIAHNVSH